MLCVAVPLEVPLQFAPWMVGNPEAERRPVARSIVIATERRGMDKIAEVAQSPNRTGAHR